MKIVDISYVENLKKEMAEYLNKLLLLFFIVATRQANYV
jgi:cob(I)alamin adenosyltransferase